MSQSGESETKATQRVGEEKTAMTVTLLRALLPSSRTCSTNLHSSVGALCKFDWNGVDRLMVPSDKWPISTFGCKTRSRVFEVTVAVITNHFPIVVEVPSPVSKSLNALPIMR